MPKDTRAAAHKRAREKAQQERQKQKQQRRIEARERKGSEASGNEDPDIAGIQPGPQPRPEWLDDLDSEESDAESAEPPR
jgi:hypothetical protein